MSAMYDIRDAFVGGEAEFWDELSDSIFRGEIGDIVVEGNMLKILFNWLARGEGFPLPQRWIKCDESERLIITDLYDISNIGPGQRGGNRVMLSSDILGKNVILFPSDGSKLDPGKVENLFLKERINAGAV